MFNVNDVIYVLLAQIIAHISFRIFFLSIWFELESLLLWLDY